MRSPALALVAAVSLGVVVVAAVPNLARAAVTAADASVEEIARARRAYKKAEKLKALGRFEEALKEYEHGFEIVELPEFLFNIGQCQRNLERYDAAIFSFKQFLARKPDAPNRPAVEALLTELEQKRKQSDVLKLTGASEDKGGGGGSGRGDPGAGPSSPIYKKWWFIAGLVGVGVVAGTVALSSGGGGGVPSSDLGNVDLR